MYKQVVYKRQLLGQIFLKRGLINKDQLKEALELQKKSKEFLGQILVKLGYLNERNLVMGLSMQCNIPYLPPLRYKTNADMAAIIPKDFAVSNHVICMDKFEDVLTIAIANPLDEALLEKIVQISKCSLGLCIATIKEIDEAIEKSYAKNKEASAPK